MDQIYDMFIFTDQWFSSEISLLSRDNVILFHFSSAVGPFTSFPVTDVAVWVSQLIGCKEQISTTSLALFNVVS